MNERYRFSGEAGSFAKLALTEKEVDVIKKLGLTPEDLHKLLITQPFAEGSYALLFELPRSNSDLVTKAWKNPQHGSGREANENVALRLLRIHGYKSAPKLEGYLKTSSILFEEKIEGETVEHFDKDIIDRLAVALANLHSIELNAYGKPLTERKKGSRMDYLLDGIETLRQIALPFRGQTETMGLINRLLVRMKDAADRTGEAFSDDRFTLIHFDLNPSNIIYSRKDGALAIVDWEQASAGDNAMDIAKLFLKSGFDADQKQEFLTQYESHLPKKGPHFQERLRVYELFVLINSIIWRLGVLRDKPERVSPGNEEQFYDRVKTNLDKEIDTLKNFLSE
ncbi:MAG: phosphotransferase [Candidatus Kerfeldbacteria bacterium]|nr:phosphotransferase [Candidatus Kerfeldbacteria bacterium]